MLCKATGAGPRPAGLTTPGTVSIPPSRIASSNGPMAVSPSPPDHRVHGPLRLPEYILGDERDAVAAEEDKAAGNSLLHRRGDLDRLRMLAR